MSRLEMIKEYLTPYIVERIQVETVLYRIISSDGQLDNREL